MIKLYETSPYMKTFDAVVTETSEGKDGHYYTVLDQTAFFPEGGGQPSDVGTLNDVFVIHVSEENGKVIHETAAPLEAGQKVAGKIDWERRFSNMQNHSGEHLVSGLIHRTFGYDNVGFHMGHDGITIDFNGLLTQDQLWEIERRANRMIHENLPVCVTYPDEEELHRRDYRSKKEIEGQVRLVEIPGADLCACCGTHVERTGEIGLVKFTGMIHYKGGVRISLLCGMRALEDYERVKEQTRQISVLLSAKPETLVEAVEKLKAEAADKDMRMGALYRQLFSVRSSAMKASGDPLFIVEELPAVQLRQFANLLMEEGKGSVILAMTPAEKGYQYVLASKETDVRPVNRELTKRFGGRGGGSERMAQGSLGGEANEIRELFLRLVREEKEAL